MSKRLLDSSSGGFEMASSNCPTAGTAGHGSSGRSLTRLQSHAPSHLSASDEDSTGSNPRAKCKDPLHSQPIAVSTFFGHCNANEQPPPTTAPGPSYAGMVEPHPLESEPGLSPSP